MRVRTPGASALGLEPGASRGDIVRAYRRLALLTHPDVSGHPAAPQRFAALTDAYHRALAEADTRRRPSGPLGATIVVPRGWATVRGRSRPRHAASVRTTEDHDHGPRTRSRAFGISVAAELTGVNAQMLRTYEAKGLLEPHRTDGGTRRYSQGDLTRVNRISSLLGDGLNLAGIAQVLALEAETRRLRDKVDRLEDRLRREQS